MSDRFNHTKYLVRKKVFKFWGQAFHIFGEDGELLFYSRLKAFKLKEDIKVYTGEDMQTEVLIIRARQILDFSAVYDVIDPLTNEKIGALKRKGFKSILKDEWVFMDVQDNEMGSIREDNMGLALLRRIMLNLIPQEYNGYIGDKQVCSFKQNFNPFVLKINLDFSQNNEELLDKRLGIAASILLSAIEGKQD